MACRKSMNICILKYFLAARNCINILLRSSSLRVKGMSLLTCSYIGERRDGRKFKCENKPFIVFILILRRVLI